MSAPRDHKAFSLIRKRSLVRVQAGPLQKSLNLQVKRGKEDALLICSGAFVQQPCSNAESLLQY